MYIYIYVCIYWFVVLNSSLIIPSWSSQIIWPDVAHWVLRGGVKQRDLRRWYLF